MSTFNLRYYSQIYWHFTGSPENVPWSQVESPKDILEYDLKSPKRALEIASQILEQGKLMATATTEHKINETLYQSSPFCCVTDIPLKDLQIHSHYYGQVAIGFHSTSIHDTWFPVLYIPMKRLAAFDLWVGYPLQMAHDLLPHKERHNFHEGNMSVDVYDPHPFIHTADAHAVPEILSWVKFTEFSPKPGGSFYQEREWRHLGDFKFATSDVAALVVPPDLIREAKIMLENNDLSAVSVISWDIIERG